jgi:cytochrome c biogenesis protein CcdA
MSSRRLSRKRRKNPVVVNVSYLVSFLGGVLSLLSPCSALLLPAFFAYAFGGGGELVKKTGVFYLGLAATLVPLGMGISAVSALFYGQRGLLITVSGVLLIAFGVLQLFGLGFTVGPLVRLRSKVRGDSAGAVFALGAVYGFAGFCSGPILGAVLTVAAASDGVLRGASLLAVYAAGMAAPLFLMALLWDRLDLGRRRWLRGREVGIGKLRFHTTNLISGIMFIVLGVVFIVYQGTSALSGLYESNGATNVAFAVEQWTEEIAQGVPAVVVLAVIIGLLAAIYLYRRSLGGKEKHARR